MVMPLLYESFLKNLMLESAVRSLKKSYVTAQEVKKRKTDEVDVVLESLLSKKRDQCLLFSDKLDTQVQAYIRASQRLNVVQLIPLL